MKLNSSSSGLSIPSTGSSLSMFVMDITSRSWVSSSFDSAVRSSYSIWSCLSKYPLADFWLEIYKYPRIDAISMHVIVPSNRK